MSSTELQDDIEAVAIIGMAGRFPQAKNVEAFWENLKNGVESVAFFTEEELISGGVAPEHVAHPDYVRAKAVLEDIEMFDAAFFGLNPREAETMDPQQRFFLECAWDALESAGYDSEQYGGTVGVYAGVSLNSYLMLNLLSNPELIDEAGLLQASIRNRTDHLTTRVAYKLNLKGPGVTVQTACSTALVAIHLACQGLLNYQCDMVLAGGVTISVPKKAGYIFQEGGVLSRDGHCRAFDAAATGTVVGNGVGIVVLKRLSEAIADGDHIHAVIKGSAINNDGSVKVGYTAPSVDGQSEVIAHAQAVAGVEPETITYVETHGTGTSLGDPVEIAALTQVFRSGTARRQFCAIGSVKSNIGHLDVAAGVAGLIKTALALEHKAIPPSLHFVRPNPQIDFASSPFYVNDRLAEWKAEEGTPRRAGISSFGIGGTNAHAVLEEAPDAGPSGPSRPRQLLVLSAKTSSALGAATTNLSRYLREHPEAELADIAYTLQVGRRPFGHRRVLVCRDATDAAAALESLDPRRVATSLQEPKERPVAFMFPGQGAQYVRMGRGLYEGEAAFREHVDLCCEHLKPHLGLDLRDVLYPRDGDEAEVEERLKQTAITQPALFVVEYALAKLLEEWGVRPQAMIGHSIGEYAAACLAGVFSLEDALRLVAARGRLMQSAAPGAMLSVPLAEADVRPLLGGQLSLAAINAPSLCVVAGPTDEVEGLEARLAQDNVVCRRLRTSHAFHSSLMEPILGQFVSEFGGVRLNAPSIPFVSNLSGDWITAAEATDPAYWARHLRETVRFGEGVARLFAEQDSVLLEVGPGKTLMTVARWHPAKAAGQVVLTTLPRPEERGDDLTFTLNALGRLWLAGIRVNWGGFYARERRRRVPLPTYPFERQHYWVEPRSHAVGGAGAQKSLRKKADVAEWFYVPSWKGSVPPDFAPSNGAADTDSCWLIFADDGGFGSRLARRLGQAGRTVLSVSAGERYARDGEASFTVNPRSPADYDALLDEVSGLGKRLTNVVHAWCVTGRGEAEGSDDDASFERMQGLGFYSLLALTQALGKRAESGPLSVAILTDDMQQVTGDEKLRPEKATVLGPCKVAPQEYPNLSCWSVDLHLPSRDSAAEDELVELLAAELSLGSKDSVIAYRNNRRWVLTFEQHRIEKPPPEISGLRDGGVYLITGGLGGLGLVLAEHLAKSAHNVKLVLVGRTPFPTRESWPRLLGGHGADGAAGRIRKIQELESHGAQVLVESADVTDEGQMRGVVERASARFGRVHGVVHTAGVPGGGIIQFKTPEKAASILAPKVQGARILGKLFHDSQLDFMLLCSSRSAVLGGFGQVDYCAANAFLDAFAHYNSSAGNARTIAVDWDGWQDVGMLVETAARYGVGRGEGESAAGEETGHPLLGRRVLRTAEREVFVSEFGVASQWILEEHRIGGTAVLPGVTYLEMARAAFEAREGGGEVEIHDVFFISPLSVKDEEQRDVRFVLEREGDGYKFQAFSKPSLDTSAQPNWQPHVTGQVRRARAHPAARHDLAAIAGRLRPDETILAEEVRDPDLGPRWQNIRRAFVGDGEILIMFELAEEFAQDLVTYGLHPSLLDRAAGTGMFYLELDGVYLPLSYKHLRLRRPLTRRIYAHIRMPADYRPKKETISFDVVITDEHGDELAAIEQFSEKRINDLTERIKAMAEQSPTAPASGAQEPIAADSSFYQESIEAGIAPHEGADAFSRILAHRLSSQVVVSTKDLEASFERVNAFTRERVSQEIEKLQAGAQRPLHPRPDVQTAYVAPRDETEGVLAAILRELLGVEQVGVNDNFFELGGDSVLSIQVIARASRLGLSITPQQIFQHQTIAELSAVVGGQPADAQATPAAQESLTPAPFELADLDEAKLSQLTHLIEEADEEEEGQGREGALAIAAPEISPAAAEAKVPPATTATNAAAADQPAQGRGNGNEPDSNGYARVAEIEDVLRQHPSVREAVVVERRDGTGGDGLVAYVVLDGGAAARPAARPMEFSLFYFSADDARAGADKYRLYLEGAKYADRHGFEAVWTPERHFHASGGLYPNPSVLSAALAAVTERVGLRAGSVVMPLHHSIRIAEDWSVIDNLSNGRVGLSFTSGWIPNDFAFFPERYANKREEMYRGIEEVRRLWRGETVSALDGAGNDVELRIFPRPIQPELPVWLTCSGDPQTFVKAGELGFNVLTALLAQSVDELAGKLALYREARSRHGHDPEAGHVTLMIHTFVGEDERDVLEEVRAPLSEYLREHVGLIETMTKSLDIKVDIDKEQYLDHLIAFAFERYYQTASLIGTPEKCLRMVEKLKQIDVNELACFIDFGVGVESVLGSLRHLKGLKEDSSSLTDYRAAGAEVSAAAGSELSEFVRDQLPQRGSEISFVLLDNLPVKPGGGIDVTALPAPGAPQTGRPLSESQDSLSESKI